MLAGQSFSLPSSEVFPYPNNDQFIPKRKRKPAGTPDPDAEVVYLSPEMLMESDRYVCEICNQSFQREQNLQMHRRRHKVPWKLLKRPEKQEIKKRVYVCPEPTCLHHDPSHALGDLVGIKKHFRRKHSNFKQWVCEKCSKGYAVQSDYKAHIKICGTRGHSCDCGRVFSRVEAFIEHQDACKGHMRSNYVPSSAAGAGEGTSTHGKNNYLSHSPIFSPPPAAAAAPFLRSHPNFSNKKPAADHTHTTTTTTSTHGQKKNNLDIHDHLPSYEARVEKNIINNFSHNLELELFTSSCSLDNNTINLEDNNIVEEIPEEAFRLRVEAKEISRMAMAEKKFAEEKRKEAKCLIGLAMQEMNEAKRIKEETVAELHAANVLKECSTSKIIINNNSNNNNNLLQVKCNSCRKDFLTLAQESFGEPHQDGNFNSNSNLMLWTRYP